MDKRFELAAFADEADSNIDGQIRIMKKNGIDQLEIRGVNGKNISDLSVAEAVQIRKQLDDADIRVWSLGSPYGKISIHDDFDKHLDYFKYGLELAGILGAGHVRMFSFYVDHSELEQCRDKVFKRLEAFAEAAKGYDVVLCHENEKGIYGDMASRCLEIHQAFPSIKAVFDPANYVQCGQDTKKAWELICPYIEYMHIKDAYEDGEVVPAGKGAGNLGYLLSNYGNKMLTLEPHLSVFEGFDKLEKSEGTGRQKYCYASSEEAFTAAADALKALIATI